MASGLAWRGSAVGVSARGRAMSMNAARGASARSSPGGVGRYRAGAARGSGRVADAFDVARRRRTRGERARRSVTRAMLSFDENASGDDYEFDENFGLRAPKRERLAFETVEWHADTLQRRCKDTLDWIDKSGVWTVGTTGGALLITAFDSLFDTGTVDPVALSVLAPDWISSQDGDPSFLYDLLAGLYVDPGTVASAETTLQGIFLFEFVLRAWAERFNPAYLKSPVALVDFAAILPSVDALVFSGLGGSSASAALRPLRLFRLLRLLRLLDDGAGNVSTLDARRRRRRGDGSTNESQKTPQVGDRVASVAVEFLCVFLISGELFYDLEYEVNPAISDVGDALYWSFLTLTGIGQPFEAVTAQGRVATVGSILTALVVVPLQLAKIVGANQDNPVVSTAGGLPLGTGGGVGAAADENERSATRSRLDEPPFGTNENENENATSSLRSVSVRETGSSNASSFGGRTTAVNASAFETFDSVDEAYAAEVYGLNSATAAAAAASENSEKSRGGGQKLSVKDDFYGETDSESVRSGAAYASVCRELADARARLRAFEDEVDDLRAENAALRAVVTRRRIKAEAERRA